MDNLTKSQIEQQIKKLRPWRYDHVYQGGVIKSDNRLTADMHEQFGRALMTHILTTLGEHKNPKDLRAIDLGCLEGHFSDILCSMGYKEVVAIDLSERHVQRANFLLKDLKKHTNITVIQGNVTDEQFMASLGTFHVVVFRGLLYHLKDPLRMFDIIERLIPQHDDFYLLLGTQYKGSYTSVISPYPIAELQIKPLPRQESADILHSPSDESAFERCSLRLNPAAVYEVLQVYGYKGIIAYDTPQGRAVTYNSNFIITKQHVPDMATRLNQGLRIQGVKFYEWNGQSVNSYDFRQHIKAQVIRFVWTFFHRFINMVMKQQLQAWYWLLIRAIKKLPGIL
jgi:SAM-dependent methyltransferase